MSRGIFTPGTLESTLTDLKKAIDWLKTYGIERNQTRFGGVEKSLALVLEHRRARTEHLLLALISPSQYGLAYVDAMELVQVRKALGKWKSSRFVEKLRLACKGPDDPREERKIGANARDILFELSVVAFFRACGIPALVGFGGDGILSFEGERILIESKRMQSSKAVGPAVQKAIKQLRQRLRQRHPRRGFGLVALDISRVMNPKHNFLLPPPEPAFSQLVEGMISEFALKHRRHIASVSDPPMLGTIIFLRVPGFDTRHSRYLSIFKTTIIYCGQPGTVSEFLAKRLHLKLLQRPGASETSISY
jgi:hypothetical protein